MEFHALLSNSSKIFDNSNIIDKIHQYIIDLKYNPPKNQIQLIFEESISYIDNDLDTKTTDELFNLILSCFSLLPEQSEDFFNELYNNAYKNSNRLVLCSLIFSEKNHKLSFPFIDSFASDTLEQVLNQIQHPTGNFKIFDLIIKPKYVSNFVSQIVLMNQLSPENVVITYSYILSQKNIPRSTIDKLIHKITIPNYITNFSNKSDTPNNLCISKTFLPEWFFSDENIFPSFSEEDLATIVQMASDASFHKILLLICRNFSEPRKLNPKFVANLLNKCIDLNINLISSEETKTIIPNIQNSLESSIMNLDYWPYFANNGITISDEILKEIKNLPDPITAMKVIPNIELLPKEFFEQLLFETTDIDVFEHLARFDMSHKNIDVLHKYEFLLHLFSVISSSEKKYSELLLIQFSELYLQILSEDDFCRFFIFLISQNYPTSDYGNNFLFDLSNKCLSKRLDYQNCLIQILDNIIEKGIPPLPSFWSLYDAEFINELYQKNEDEPMLLYAYAITNAQKPADDENGAMKIKLKFNQKINQDSFTLFIKNKDFKFITNVDRESLKVIMAAYILANHKRQIEIEGLSISLVFPFVAVYITFLNNNNNSEFPLLPTNIDGLFLLACRNLNKIISELTKESINTILSSKYVFESPIFSLQTALNIPFYFIIYFYRDIYQADIVLLFILFFKFSCRYPELMERMVKETAKENLLYILIKCFIVSFYSNKYPCFFNTNKSIDYPDDFMCNLGIFNADIASKNLVDQISYSFILPCSSKIIHFLEFYCYNIPKLDFKDDDFLIESANKKILKKKWEKFYILNKFIRENKIENQENDQLIDKDYIDILLKDLMNFTKFQKNEYAYKLILDFLMENKNIIIDFFVVLLEKICHQQTFNPEVFLKNYRDIYLKYSTQFIEAISLTFMIHPSELVFVRKTEFGEIDNQSTGLSQSIVSMLIKEANNSSSSYQIFYCLKNIAYSFPFLLNNDIISTFEVVLNALDSFSLYFTVSNDSPIEAKSFNQLKTAILALSFLHVSLTSVQVLESFIPWIYNSISEFSESQILAFTYVLISLFSTTKVKDIVFALSIKFNFAEITRKLFEKKVSKEIESYYKTNLYKLCIKFYKYLNKLKHKKELIYIDEIMKTNTPFQLAFDNFITINPIKLKPLNLPDINNKDVKSFNDDCSPITPFPNNQSQYNIAPCEIESFILNYLQQLNEEPNIDQIDPIDLSDTDNIRCIRYCARQPNWIYQWIINNETFPIFNEHNEILKTIINDLQKNVINNDENEANNLNFQNKDSSYFFSHVFDQPELFYFLIKESLSKVNEAEFSKVFNVLTATEVGLRITLESISIYISDRIEEGKSIESMKILVKIIISSLADRQIFKEQFIKFCGDKLIDISLSPDYREDVEYLSYVAQIFLVLDNLPIRLIHLVGFILLSFNQQFILQGLKLLHKIGDDKAVYINNVFDQLVEEIYRGQKPSSELINSLSKIPLISDKIASKTI